MLDKVKTKKQLLKKVLLAEDNEVNQLVFKGMIHELGFAVDVAENGKHAIDMWKQANYDVIFMDCQSLIIIHHTKNPGINSCAVLSDETLEKPSTGHYDLPLDHYFRQFTGERNDFPK